MKRTLIAALACLALTPALVVAQTTPGGPPPGPPPGAAGAGAPGGPPPGGPPGPGGYDPMRTPALAPGEKPSWNGVWSHPFMSKTDKDFFYLDNVPDLSMMQPWAKAEWMRHYDGIKGGHQLLVTSLRCLPAGTPNVMMEAHALQVILTKKEIIFLAESDHQVRIVPIGANLKHPVDLSPTWYGDAIAHWEGDTLVIDTVGLNDRSELDPMGSPHSSALHVVERMRLLPDGQLEAIVRMEDPLALTKPWVYSYHYNKHGREGTTENVGEYACAENNRDGVITPER